MTTTTTPQAMPAWLTQKLVADGVMDATTRLTSRLRPRRCAGCGLYGMAALDDLGLPVLLELHPTTSAGELFALLTGRASYGLDFGELYPRTAAHITARPADREKTYVTHACHSPPIPANARFTPRPKPTPTDLPPF